MGDLLWVARVYSLPTGRACHGLDSLG
jgi:hypothetical protein